MYSSPSLKRPVIARFPVCQFRRNGKARLYDHVKAEKCTILEHDANAIAVVGWFDFYTVHDLAFDLSETTALASLDILTVSQMCLQSGALVRAASVFAHWRSPLYGVFHFQSCTRKPITQEAICHFDKLFFPVTASLFYHLQPYVSKG